MKPEIARLALVCVLGLTHGAVAAEEAQPIGRMPNVLWICTDQQRWDTIGALTGSD